MENIQISPGELRIGNLLQDKVTKTVLKVTGLNENDIETYVIDRSKFPLKTGWELEPIPLTEEWLLRFGFEYIEHFYSDKSSQFVYKKNRLVIVLTGGKDFIVAISSPSISSEHNYAATLKFVHQLQNIYYSLADVELADL